MWSHCTVQKAQTYLLTYLVLHRTSYSSLEWLETPSVLTEPIQYTTKKTVFITNTKCHSTMLTKAWYKMTKTAYIKITHQKGSSGWIVLTWQWNAHPLIIDIFKDEVFWCFVRKIQTHITVNWVLHIACSSWLLQYNRCEKFTFCIVISSSEMLKPHWLKSSHVTGTINAYCFFYTPMCANMNVNSAFFSRHWTADSYAWKVK